MCLKIQKLQIPTLKNFMPCSDYVSNVLPTTFIHNNCILIIDSNYNTIIVNKSVW
jgi:hypothetical protein